MDKKKSRTPLAQEPLKQFDTIKEDTAKQNDILKLSMGTIIVCFAIVCLVVVTQNKFNLLRVSKYYSTENLKETICGYGVEQLLAGKLEDDVYESRLIERVNDSGLSPHITKKLKIFSPVMVKDELCKVVIQDDIGLRGFEFKIEEGGSLFYQISNFVELEQDQTKTY